MCWATTGRCTTSAAEEIGEGLWLRERLLEGARAKVEEAVARATQARGRPDWSYVKNKMRDTLGEYLYQTLRRRPMILPVVVEV